MQSVALHHPDARRFCVVVDTDLTHARALSAEFDIVPLNCLGSPEGKDFSFCSSVLELNVAVKPWAFQYFIDAGFDRVVYLDPDMFLFQPLSEAFSLLDQGASVVTAPHLHVLLAQNSRSEPRAGGWTPGFCVVRNNELGLQLLLLWRGAGDDLAQGEVEGGGNSDRIDFPLHLSKNGICLLANPGYQVTSRTLVKLRVSECAGGWSVDGQPLVLIQFSGFVSRSSGELPKRVEEAVSAEICGLLRDYAQKLADNGMKRYQTLPCEFSESSVEAGQVIRERSRNSVEKKGAEMGGGESNLAGLRSFSERGRDIAPEHIARLQLLYRQLLGRLPDDLALQALGPFMEHPIRVLYAVMVVGFSREARATPGWFARLLRFSNMVSFNPNVIKRWVTLPMERFVAVAGKYRESLSYRPHPGCSYVRNGALTAQASLIKAGRTNLPWGVNLVGYVKAELGVGEALRSFARACDSANIPFSLTDVGYQSKNRQQDDSIISRAQNKCFSIDVYYVNADQTSATLQQLQAGGRLSGNYSIGFWHWEQPEFPASFHEAFACVDEVWVPSTFVQDAVAPVSPVPVFKVPHALQFSPSTNACRSRFGLSEDLQLVLVMYDFNSYQYRKNPQAAIEAFRLAMHKAPNLGLVIKTINHQQNPAAFEELKDALKDMKRVKMINEFFTRQDTWDLEYCCDIFLSLHRAEGFGLGPAEMMLLGKPVVATGWSANMDFMNARNSMPVDYCLKPLESDIGVYPAGPVWAEADVDHAAWCLSQLAADSGLRQRLGSRAASDIKNQLSPLVVGEKIRQRLRIIGDRLA